MPSHDRRAAGRRRAWGRGPIILRFEPLEGRALLSTTPATGTTAATAAVQGPDLVASAFDTLHNLDWGQAFNAAGTITNVGDAPNPGPFRVDVYAATTATPDTNSTLLGSVLITQTIAPGQSVNFSQVMTAPPAPLATLNGSNTYNITLNVDPTNAVGETSMADKMGRGQGFDTSVVTISPALPTALIGTGMALSSGVASWGDTLTLGAKVTNNAQGNAPATNAKVVLTPAGQTPSLANSFTIATVTVPAIGAYQTATIDQPISLPTAPPSILANSSSFNVSLILDADGAADPVMPHPPSQGQGFDSVPLQLNAMPASTPAGLLPDLAVAAIQAPQQALAWGGTYQVGTTVQNLGKSDAGPFKVRFLLATSTDPTAPILDLGDATVPGLKAGFAQTITQTVKLPFRIPSALAATANAGMIVVQIDPFHELDDANIINNTLDGPPVALRVVGTDGLSVPAPIFGTLGPTGIDTPPPPTTTAGTATPTTSTTTSPTATTTTDVIASNPTSPAARPPSTPQTTTATSPPAATNGVGTPAATSNGGTGTTTPTATARATALARAKAAAAQKRNVWQQIQHEGDVLKKQFLRIFQTHHNPPKPQARSKY